MLPAPPPAEPPFPPPGSEGAEGGGGGDGVPASLAGVAGDSGPHHESAAGDTGVDEDLATLSEVAATLDGVEAALGRISDGTYGRCTRCGAEIDDADLEADPLATHCPEHAY